MKKCCSGPVCVFLLAAAAFLAVGCSGGSVRQGPESGPSLSLTQGGDRLLRQGDGICRDVRTGLMWQVEASRTIHSLAEAQAYVRQLRLGGYEDWRLPTISELYDLYTVFDLHLNGECTLEVEGTYWSDEPDMDGRVGTWELDDNCDPERQYIPKKKGRVRAVRP